MNAACTSNRLPCKKNISPLILEKDFWVCWLLELLFNSPLSESLVFKGGTSLSKVFQVIERFSEDIDLSVSPSFLDLPPPGTTRNQAHKWMKLAEAACAAVVRDRLCSTLDMQVAELLGRSKQGWFEFLIDAVTSSPILLFHYPSSQPPGFDYLIRSVKLESDHSPISNLWEDIQYALGLQICSPRLFQTGTVK